MERTVEGRASIRTAVIQDACLAHLNDGGPRTVLDVGGGTGGLAVRIAGLGHRVTVLDPSPDALAALGRRSREAGVEGAVVARQGDLAGIGEAVAPASVDLVLCHDVLGLVEDPVAALRGIHRVLAPGGALSLVVGQRHAAVLSRAVAGDFATARRLMDGEDLETRRFTVAEVTSMLAETGFSAIGVQGVRIFSDLVPSALLDLDPGAVGALLDLERAASSRPEYHSMAAMLHLWGTA